MPWTTPRHWTFCRGCGGPVPTASPRAILDADSVHAPDCPVMAGRQPPANEWEQADVYERRFATMVDGRRVGRYVGGA